jgi:hypothetical protein
MERDSRRRIAGGAFVIAFTLLVGDALIKDTDLLPMGRLLLVAAAVLAAVYWVATTAVLSPHLPQMAMGRDEAGVRTIKLLKPERPGSRRLREETMDLVVDMRRHISQAPPSFSIQEHRAVTTRMDAAKSDQERDAVWAAYTDELSNNMEQVNRANNAAFGGRSAHVMGEFQRRGLATEQDVRRLLWNISSDYWMVEAANTLEALARRL